MLSLSAWRGRWVRRGHGGLDAACVGWRVGPGYPVGVRAFDRVGGSVGGHAMGCGRAWACPRSGRAMVDGWQYPGLPAMAAVRVVDGVRRAGAACVRCRWLDRGWGWCRGRACSSEEHTSELQSLMRI